MTPIFDYSCLECNKKSELIIKDGVKPKCPYCESMKMVKLPPTGVGVIYNGEGFTKKVTNE